MAKPTLPQASAPQDTIPADALQHPLLSRNALLTAAGISLALWLTAVMTGSKVALIVVGVVNVAAAGAYVWLWRTHKRQKAVLDLLASGQGSKEARLAALAQLQQADKGSKDVVGRIARAQLEMQDDPDRALVTLEGIDLAKVPAVAADEVRVVRGQIYLYKGRLAEARQMADDIKLANAQSGQSRAMMTAVVAEAWARTGKAEAAWDLLEPHDPAAADNKQVRWPLLFARIFASFHANKRDRCRKELHTLMADDMNLLGRFVQPGMKVHPELMKLAQQVLQSHPEVKRMARQAQRGGQRFR
jgi:hypothetical protein